MNFISLNTIICAFIVTAIAIAHNRTIFQDRVFKLPRLVVRSSGIYLLKNRVTDLSCTIESGWPNLSFASKIVWLKDGVPVDELNRLKKQELLEHRYNLSIRGGRSYVEGNYQCKADIQGIRLADDKKVTVKLISAPVKLKRARITGFTDVGVTTVQAELGEIARIPCNGLPDVVPGPPSVNFQKQEESGPSFNEQDFWVTSTGLQLLVREPSYAGTYFCTASNLFTNITRKSRSPIKLQASIARKNHVVNPIPKIVYPLEETSLEHPIVVNINRGRSAVLECIISDAKVTWKRYNSLDSSFGPVTIGNHRDSKFQLRFSNLDINYIDEADSGIYVCEGKPLYQRTVLTNIVNDTGTIPTPKVYYKLYVRSPTNVLFHINQIHADKSWQLNCRGVNFDYEVPTVYINGETLQDAMDKLGVPPSVDFFSNPVKVTLAANTISGSVQCVSHPAMDEAEIYGDGLERGRATNLYVDNSENMQVNLITEGPYNVTVSLSETAELTCRVHGQATAWRWLKDNISINILGRIRMLNGKLCIRNVTLNDSGWYTCEATASKRSNRASAYLKVIDPNRANSAPLGKSDKNEINETTGEHKTQGSTTFINASLVPFTMDVSRASVSGRSVQLHWSYQEHHPASENIKAFKIELCTEHMQEWAEAQELPSYVRHATIGTLTPGQKYKFRVVAVLSGQTSVNSFPTDWVLIEQTKDGVMLPPEPRVEKLSAVSDSVLKLKWRTGFTSTNNTPESFLVTYGKSSSTKTTTMVVQGNETQTTITGLEPSTEYRVTVSSRNAAGWSPRSQPVYARTHVKYRITSPKNDNTTSVFGWIHQKTENLTMHINQHSFLIVFSIFLLLSLLVALAYALFRKLHSKTAKKINQAAKGKFADTSHRIFNEQLVLKKRLHYNNNRFRRRPSEEINSSSQSSYFNYRTSPPTTSMQDFCFEMQVNPTNNECEDDRTYYNEEALLIPPYEWKRANELRRHLATPLLSNGSKENHATTYGELMLCSEAPENGNSEVTTAPVDNHQTPIAETNIRNREKTTLATDKLPALKSDSMEINVPTTMSHLSNNIKNGISPSSQVSLQYSHVHKLDQQFFLRKRHVVPLLASFASNSNKK